MEFKLDIDKAKRIEGGSTLKTTGGTLRILFATPFKKPLS